jgi:hypothetical protein
MKVEDLWENRIKHTQQQKTRQWLEKFNKQHPNMDEEMKLKASPKKAIENFFKSFQPFVKMVLTNNDFDTEETEYYQYLINHLHPHDLIPSMTGKGKSHLRTKCKNAVNLIKDIRDNGIKDPFDMWLENGNRILRKGHRRLVILKELGVKDVDVRVWKDEETFYRNQTGHIPKKWRKRFGR